MKFVITAAAAVCVLAGSALAADTKTFVDLENAWMKALIARDTASLTTIIAEDWSGLSDSPKPLPRAGEIALVKSGKLKIESATVRDVKVRVVGTIAVVQGYDDEKSSYDGKDGSGSYCWTDVFENRGGKWVAVASQVTKVKK